MSDDVSYSGAYSGSGERPSGGDEPAGDAFERPKGSPERTFLGELVYRRVPQVLAGYLGVTWTLFELSQWLTDQYLVSPYLGRTLLLGLLLLLPSVLVVTYRHGRPGPDQWTDSELWIVSGNIAAAVFTLLIVFGGVELGSMVRTVQVSAADTTGSETTENIVRQVPKKQFRQRLALFYFDEAEGTRADTALLRAAPTALRADLEQDPFISAYSPVRFDEELRQRGYDDGLNVPLGLKREVAREANADYVLSGRVGTTQAGTTLLGIWLRETETGDLVAKRQFEGEGLFDVIDRASTQLKKNLGLPDAHLESATDLPVTQVFTSSVPAAKHYAQGFHLSRFGKANLQKSARKFGRATNTDTTFALGYIGEGRTLWRLGEGEKARRAFRSAKRHSYRLSESRAYWLKAFRLYRLEGRPQAALRVCEQWTSLHPYDLDGWKLKAILHRSLLQHKQALESYRRILALAPKSKTAKTGVITGLLQTGRFKKALQRAESFTETYPKDKRGPLLVGTIRWRLGRLTQAAKAFRQAERMGARNAEIYLAMLSQARGQFKAALSRIQEVSRNPQSRWTGYRLWHHHWLRGRIERSKHVLDSLRTIESSGPEVRRRYYLASRTCNYYGPLGSDKLVNRTIKRLKALKQKVSSSIPGYEIMAETGLAHCKIAVNRLTEAQRHLRQAMALVERPGTPPRYRLSLALDYVRGRLREAQGRYQDAATSYERYLKDRSKRQPFLGTLRLPRLRLARSYQKADRPDKAEEAYQDALALHPAHPRLNYYYARFLVDQGRREAARKPLRRALNGWIPADSDFRPKRRALSLADSLGIQPA
ncbi:MAG: tetratricopeptide repeat protein [Salinibacter sp.]|uniref:tetratricopeptide repeat protein n=1 Tax=Salinibacter sp. TaxID=2065818 RepID=UPI0035D487AC